jgi:hypothetical protein
MELFVKIRPYEEAKTPGENLTALAGDLEAKKARRQASFYRRAFGVEKPVPQSTPSSLEEKAKVPDGWELTSDGERLAGEDHFLAVVHLDGNAMGKQVQAIYESCKTDWDECVQKLREFSEGIDRIFAKAYDEMCQELANALDAECGETMEPRIFPVRKVIGAGDDVCFIARGSLGIACAVSYLKHLNHLSNGHYAACAGVTMIHTKYPFHRAYDLAEELCGNAKKFGTKLSPDGSVSAIDWHIEFGQLKGTLSQIRGDYQTEDGGRMELRPLVVLPGNGKNCPTERSYRFFCGVIQDLSKEKDTLARSKVKGLRNAFRMGEVETQVALRQNRMEELLWSGVRQRFPDFAQRLLRGENLKAAFATDETDPENPVRRCLYFDAIEMADHITLWREEAE